MQDTIRIPPAPLGGDQAVRDRISGSPHTLPPSGQQPDPEETGSDDFSFLLVVAARSDGSGGCAALWTSAVGVKRF